MKYQAFSHLEYDVMDSFQVTRQAQVLILVDLGWLTTS